MSIFSISDIERFVGRYSIGRDSNPYSTTGSLHFLRIRVPGGILTSNQFRGIAALSSKYGKGVAEVTDRQDIQLHWIRAEDSLEIFSFMDEMGFTTDMCGQGFRGARYGDVRNIICCPASGIEKDEIFNPCPIVKRLTKFFSGNPDFLDLPRKFKISMSGCGSDCTRAVINDLAFVAVDNGNETGFTILVGGSVGASLPGPRLAKPVKIFIRPNDVFEVAVATVKIHRDYSNRESKAKARFKWLIETWGIERFVSILEEEVGRKFEKYDGPIFKRQTDHEEVQPQKIEGQYYVNIPLLEGRLTSSLMNQIADLADKYGNEELRFTPTQKIIVPNIGEENKETVLKILRKMGFPMDRSKTRWLSVGCPSDFCGKATDICAKETVKNIVEYLEEYFGIEILKDLRLRVNVSGCPNDCSASLISDIGLIGRQIRVDRGLKQAYDIYLGGSVGEKPLLGRLVEERVQADELRLRIASFIVSYLKYRKPDEGISDFCRRHSNEELKAFFKKPEVSQNV